MAGLLRLCATLVAGRLQINYLVFLHGGRGTYRAASNRRFRCWRHMHVRVVAFLYLFGCHVVADHRFATERRHRRGELGRQRTLAGQSSRLNKRGLRRLLLTECVV